VWFSSSPPSPPANEKRIEDALAWLVDIERGVAKVREQLLAVRAPITTDDDVAMAALVRDWMDGTSPASTLAGAAKHRFGASGSKKAGEWLAKYSRIGPQIPSSLAYSASGDTKWLEIARVALANFALIRGAT
jgi:hypothetical protein